MSSKSRPVEYGGVVWKVVPGSRREQLLLRFIEQDRKAQNTGGVFVSDFGVHVVPDSVPAWHEVVWLWIGIAVGAAGVGGAWWLI